ncbi:hypothetical protein [Methylobacterium sp. J-070]|uniref:hypothetical protein n=1 Tax=Methylobacterium sp. J-070 TaxID=2836650 RepID=UPI001FB8E01C|nr:hypothetical protein [Methylobacterium sp. J-070]MCJ2051683.1 hypothetical protein [Methylobacterium sp. J-070]
MLTAYLVHLQHASAGAQITFCGLSAVAVGLGPFAVADLIDHLVVNLRIAATRRADATLQLAQGAC